MKAEKTDGEKRAEELIESVKDVEAGKIVYSVYPSEKSWGYFTGGTIKAAKDGRGKAEVYVLFPGVELSYCRFNAELAHDSGNKRSGIMQINHCRLGRIGWRTKGGRGVYLGEGDLSVHMAECCEEAEIVLPWGVYEGISILIDLEKFKQNIPEVLSEAGLDLDELYNKYCNTAEPFAKPVSDRLEHVFSELYDLPQGMRLPYYKLKVQELLMFLSMERVSELNVKRYVTKQAETIQAIHEELISDISKRYTIEELARKYLINTTTLKNTFKAVYGMPIASYMKRYRMKQAMIIIQETNKSLSEVAEAVGYENQSKFTRAFKEYSDMLPKEYRNRVKATKSRQS